MHPNDTVNRSGLYLMLARDGRIVAGAGHPDACMVLAAPGGVVPGDYVGKYRLESLLRPGAATPVVEPVAEPAVEPEAAPIEASPDEPPEDEPAMNDATANDSPEFEPTPEPTPTPPVKAVPADATANKAMRPRADKMVRAPGANKGRR